MKTIIQFSLQNKLLILLFTMIMVGYGLYATFHISIGAVPDITNNQVQVITTSRNLSTQDIEQYVTYPVELEMANLPGVKEIRSISKFGLSVVTVVFEDNMGNYLPRQLIAEKIKAAAEKIPEGFGVPEMGPITTGLGEIYQYTLEVAPEFKDQYTVADLREIQDWQVKRQLSGIPGVVEINTWGGYLKQYEVAFDPNQLHAMQISVGDILKALEQNNHIAGGAYIEKNNQSYFIRAEGQISSLQDIENILVANKNQTPIRIKDVAKVQFGHANRFGAITGNGEGEKVLGQIMMLKGANSNQVINDVKNRIALVEKSLPDGVSINGFLERSELVKKTTFTIAENLILGCLIVIFVVVLLLGNWRSGLVIASVIPLCLLFAISMMYLLGMDANLMSLGAIDFGIIIDGAVIIVEFVTFQITQKLRPLMPLSANELKEKVNHIVLESSHKMMNSAIFGQLIILIVFIPIMTLSGIEGKMFRPMAMTFSFAIFGAMILGMTYVPVISALFLNPNKTSSFKISEVIIQKIQKAYNPVIRWSLKNTKKVIIAAVTLLVVSIGIFSQMGGEFIPTLDEGDFVIQPVLKTGLPLTNTIETTTKIEKIVLENFPEVDQIVSRIGAAEVPTDPMSMEESDIIVKLKPKSDWTTTKDKEELANLIKTELEKKIPNTEIEFTQPIEMRFNELISGTRSDVGIKIFGDDLNTLARIAEDISKKIKNTPGASDVVVEKTEGLPQIKIVYDRFKLAQYNLNVFEVNQTITAAFAGSTASTVLEGEKRFDMVVRMDKAFKNNLQDVQNLWITLPNQNQIPLSEVAQVTYEKGPAKISRDNTKRRVVIGVNIRNRDLQSVVTDMQQIIDTQVKLPEGYYITYGGQFQNLESAKNRLYVAVPVALVLIFVLLYFAFQSVQVALLIYTAIPLSAVGGILLLAMRGMPFSISAGVGFIALFGIAVLNGIVLIEHFKHLKSGKYTSLKDMIIQGTSERLRPVLLTAAAAALGFLPMAISSSAGAEVQRPLATVVIGGLISATFLTLVVLPVLYLWMHEKEFKWKKNQNILPVILLLGMLMPMISTAQEKSLSRNDLVQLAWQNNLQIKALQSKIKASESNEKTAFQLQKTNVYYSFDQNNLTPSNIPLHVFGASQDFKFPTFYTAQKKVLQQQTVLDKDGLEIQKNRLAFEVCRVFEEMVFWKNRESYFKILDSLYSNFSKSNQRKFELGEANFLEKVNAEAKQKQIQLQWQQSQNEVNIRKIQLQNLLNQEIKVEEITNRLLPIAPISENNSETIIQLYNDLEQLSRLEIKKQKQDYLPDLSVEYFQGDNKGVGSSLYGVKFGVAVPLFLSKNKQKIKALTFEKENRNFQKEQMQLQLNTYQQEKEQALQQLQLGLDYYQNQGKKLSEQIIKVANQSYKAGEIDFFQYLQSLENATEIELQYLETLLQYNVLQLEKTYLPIPLN